MEIMGNLARWRVCLLSSLERQRQHFPHPMQVCRWHLPKVILVWIAGVWRLSWSVVLLQAVALCFSPFFSIRSSCFCFLLEFFLRRFLTWWSIERQRPHWLGRPLNSNPYSTNVSPSNLGMTIMCGRLLRS